MKNKTPQKLLTPIPPGEVLLEEFVKPLGVSQNKLARSLAVPVTRVHDLIHARRAITPDTALRLSQYFGTTPEFWLNLQLRYDLEKTRRKSGAAIAKSVQPLSQTA